MDEILLALAAEGDISFKRVNQTIYVAKAKKGEMLEMSDSKVPFGRNTDEIVLDVCREFDFPIISNFPCGHGDYQATLPISHVVEIHAEEDPPHILIPKSPVV